MIKLKELSNRLGVHENTIRNYIKNDIILVLNKRDLIPLKKIHPCGFLCPSLYKTLFFAKSCTFFESFLKKAFFLWICTKSIIGIC